MPKGIYKRTEETKRKISESRIGKKHSEETKIKMKESRQYQIIIHSEKTKKKISESHKGKSLSEETKRKLSKKRKGKTYEELFGKVRAEEIKKKLSNTSNGEKNPMFGKKHTEEAMKKINMRLSQVDNYLKGKTMEEYFGIEKSIEIKKKIGIKNKEHRKYQIFPKKDTKIEIKIQNLLSKLKIWYIPHKYFNIEHGYQVDLFVPILNLVIECDGDYWHNYPKGRDIDKIRTKELKEKGFKVLRLWERDIKKMKIKKFKELINTYKEKGSTPKKG